MRTGYVAWTDEEWGFIQDTMDRPRADVAAEMGRSLQAISAARRKLQRGYVPKKEYWSEDEDQYLRDTVGLSAEAVAYHLGRSYAAITHRRAYLTAKEGVTWGTPNKSPHKIGNRRLLAQTCPGCGLLLDAYWFLKYKTGGKQGMWKRSCRKCSGGPVTKEQANTYRKERNSVLQRLSLRHADRKGEEWTDADQRILADPDLSVFEKSALTKRTYFGAVHAVRAFGHTSKPEIGDPLDSRWLIRLHPDVQRLLEEKIGAMVA